MGSGVVLGLVGSPNRDARTFRLVSATLEGAARAGARVELVQMADHVVAACKDCVPWVCRDNLKCTYDDPAFDYLSEKLLNAGALVLGTPVYWSDTSAMVRYLFLKMYRVYARSAPLKGMPAVGIAVAGGSGNGLVSGLRPLYHFFYVMQMRGLEPLPATRFDWESAMKRCAELGGELAGMAGERRPFAGLEDRLLWYDGLPYLGLSRAGERRLLADLTTAALGEGDDPEIARDLARADALAAAGRLLESQTQVTRVYEAGVKAFQEKQAVSSKQ